MEAAHQRAEIRGRAVYLTANLFAVAFGVAGLAQDECDGDLVHQARVMRRAHGHLRPGLNQG